MNKLSEITNVFNPQPFKRLGRRTICALLLLSLVTGCSKGYDDLYKRFEEIRQRQGRPIEPIPDFKPTPTFAYPTHLPRRDPFFPYRNPAHVKKKNKDNNAPDLTRPKEPLEQFKLANLQMVGCLKRDEAIWGLISAPNGQIYKVTVGSYLGENFGKVVKVTEQEISVVETVKEKQAWQKKAAELKLNAKKIEYGKIEDK